MSRSHDTSSQDFMVLVTGPCATATAALIQSVAQGPVLATDIERDVPHPHRIEVGSGRSATVIGVGTFVADSPLIDDGPIDPGSDVPRVHLFGTPGADRGWGVAAALKHEVDVVTFVVDAEAGHTHAEAGVMLRELERGLAVPLVVAVNSCDDPARASSLAASLGVSVGARVVACQLIDPRSGRDVVVETLTALLNAMDATDRQVA